MARGKKTAASSGRGGQKNEWVDRWQGGKRQRRPAGAPRRGSLAGPAEAKAPELPSLLLRLLGGLRVKVEGVLEGPLRRGAHGILPSAPRVGALENLAQAPQRRAEHPRVV